MKCRTTESHTRKSERKETGNITEHSMKPKLSENVYTSISYIYSRALLPVGIQVAIPEIRTRNVCT